MPGPLSSTAPTPPRRTRATGAGPAWRRTAAGLAAGLALGLGLLAAAVAALGALALEPAPRVAERSDITHADVRRALWLLRGHDPRHALPGIRRELHAGARDLDLLLNHAAHRWLGARLDVAMQPRRAEVHASLPWHGGVGPLAFDGWLNLHAQLVQTDTLPALARLRVGALELPPALALRLLPVLLSRLPVPLDAEMLTEVVTDVSFTHGRLTVGYAWQEDSRWRLADALLPPPEQARLVAYRQRLAETVTAQWPRWEVSLAELLPPLFALARERTLAGGEAAAENRAALMTLAAYAVGRDLAQWLPALHWTPRPRPMRVLLAGRVDFPRHFLVSAALVTETTSPLAHAVGLYKEVQDSRGGSGFSFNDLAANLAGTRFGERALHDPERLQVQLAQGVTEAQFMPAVADLPEHLSAQEFAQRYGSVGSQAYERTLAEITQRVGALTLLR